MRIPVASSILIALAVASLGSLTACGSDSAPETYANLQDCVVDHTTNEGFTETMAITTCLLDHLPGVSFTTAADCEAYVTANGGYPNSRVAACADYIANK